MPFVELSHRKKPDLLIPGDRCYVEYVEFMRMWNETPRWRTIDKFAEKIFPEKYQRAAFLALLVFMWRHGLHYEKKMMEKNGDIK